MHNGELFISRKGPASLPETWLLIDSCSTVDIISSTELLHGIHKVSNPIRVWCNAGVTTLDRMGYLGDYPQPVCYNPDGGANIMSMFNISQHNHLSMNTHEANTILMHHHNGNVTVFTPSSNGLYKHALSNNESINGFWSCIQTVSECKDHYTQHEIKTANQARRFQNIIMRPSDRELMDVSIEHIANCPITQRAIHIAKDIYGPNLGSLKGKTVQRTLPHLPSGVDLVPPELFKRHPGVTIAMDILFVNNMPFLLSMSHGLKFMMLEALPNRQVKTIKEKVWTICNMYQRHRFAMDSIYADSVFELLRPDFRLSTLPMLTTINLTSNELSDLLRIRSVAHTVCYRTSISLGDTIPTKNG